MAKTGISDVTALVGSVARTDFNTHKHSSPGFTDRGDPASEDIEFFRTDDVNTATNANHLIDINADFANDGYVIGDWIYNTDDVTSAQVTNVAPTDLTLDADIFPVIGGIGVNYQGSPYLFDGGSFNDLDLSGIVTDPTATQILVTLEMESGQIQSEINFRKKGNIQEDNMAFCATTTSDIFHRFERILFCNSNQVVEFQGTDPPWTYVSLTVRGWK